MIWKLKEKPPKEYSDEFKEYGRIISQLFWNRGLRTKEEIEKFLNPDYDSDLYDSFLMRGIREAVERTQKAIKEKEKIIIYGDYDADGISASVILYEILRYLEADFDVYIPDRFKEGYGLNETSVKEIINKKIKLVITVDCGISDFKEVAELNKHGIDTIIIDHHLIPEKIPDAVAIINPKQKEDEYPFKWLSGAGLAFKFIQALIKQNPAKFMPGWEKWLLDLVAIAAVADLVPLLGENRILVKYGLIVFSKTRRIGFQALMGKCGIKIGSAVTTDQIGFVVAPRLNAPSRMGYVNTSYELLISEFQEEADFLSQKLEETNRQRQILVERIFAEIDQRLKNLPKIPKLIFDGGNWESGVVGIVAGRLKDKYHRPVFIYGTENDKYKGSSRSINAFNVVSAMKECSNFLIEFGGHAKAGGFSCKIENISGFKGCLTKSADNLKEEDLIPVLEIEAEAEFSEIDLAFYEVLEKFEPFGEENPRPIFLTQNVRVKNFRFVGNNEKHLKMTLEKDNKFFDAISFNGADFASDLKIGDNIDIAYEIDKNEWNGYGSLQLKIRDLRISK